MTKTIMVLCYKLEVYRNINGTKLWTPVTRLNYEAYSDYITAINSLEEEYYSFLNERILVGDDIIWCDVYRCDDGEFCAVISYEDLGTEYRASFWIEAIDLVL